MTTINSVLDYTDEQLEQITDEQVKALDYGIKYFSFGAAEMEPTARRLAVIEKLAARLPKVEVVAVEIAPRVWCDCGHRVPRTQRMSTSRGTACLDCYDRMSN